jgi:polynucleotide 5'-kinase involved in rRNA processing
VQHKVRLIEAVEPDLVIGISTGTELAPILSMASVRAMSLQAAQSVLARSRGDRREIRKAGYRRYLQGATRRTLSLQEIRLKIPEEMATIQKQDEDETKDIIVGLLDKNGFLLQIGVLLSWTREKVTIYSKEAKNATTIELGFVRLTAEGDELGYVER